MSENQYIGRPLRRVVVSPLADVWDRPDEDGERVTQAWLGSQAEILKVIPGWRQVLLVEQGGYEGWIQESHLAKDMSQPSLNPRAVIATPRVELDKDRWLLMGTVLPLVDRRPGEVSLWLPGDEVIWLSVENMRPWPAWGWPKGETAVRLAAQFQGTPYLWGGMGWQGIDCSGLIFMAYWVLGVLLPRDAEDQWSATYALDDDKPLFPGDLVFFSTTRPGPSHVGMVIGEKEFLHASSSLGGVVRSSWAEKGWHDKIVGFRRVIRN